MFFVSCTFSCVRARRAPAVQKVRESRSRALYVNYPPIICKVLDVLFFSHKLPVDFTLYTSLRVAEAVGSCWWHCARGLLTKRPASCTWLQFILSKTSSEGDFAVRILSHPTQLRGFWLLFICFCFVFLIPVAVLPCCVFKEAIIYV